MKDSVKPNQSKNSVSYRKKSRRLIQKRIWNFRFKNQDIKKTLVTVVNAYRQDDQKIDEFEVKESAGDNVNVDLEPVIHQKLDDFNNKQPADAYINVGLKTVCNNVDHRNVSLSLSNYLIIKSNVTRNDYIEYNNGTTLRDKSLITSFVAAVLSKFTDVTEWSSATLDAIIYCSNDHLHSMNNSDNICQFLTNDDISECVKLNDSLICFCNVTNEIYGHLLDDNISGNVPFIDALEKCHHNYTEMIIITNNIPIVLIIRNEKFFILNITSNNKLYRELNLFPKAAYFWCFDNIREVYNHLINFTWVLPSDDATSVDNTYKILNISTCLTKTDIDVTVINELRNNYNIGIDDMVIDKSNNHFSIDDDYTQFESNFPYEVIRGNIHQGDERNFESCSRGKQCTANAISAIVFATLIPMNLWTAELIDYLLKVGNNLYHESMNALGIDKNFYRYLVADEVNREVIVTQNVSATYDIGTQYHGNLTKPDVFTKLSDCLNEFTFNNVSAVLTANSLSIAIMSRDGRYCVVDSHSKDEYGKVCNDGKACLILFRNVEQLHEFITSNMTVTENDSNYCNVYHLTIVENIELSENDRIINKTFFRSLPLTLSKALCDQGFDCDFADPQENEKNMSRDNDEPPNKRQKRGKYRKKRKNVKGKLILNYEYVFNESKELFEIHKIASFDDKCRKKNSFDFVHAKVDGLQSTLIYECSSCKFQFEVSNEPHDEDILTSNNQIILGCYMTGIGFSQLQYLLASINVQSLSYNSYCSAEIYMGLNCTKAAYESIIEAGEESKKLALMSGRIVNHPKDNTSIPFTDVVTDGCWGKRGYASGLYNSASGAAVAVDYHTHKVLDFGVANKRCFQCQLGSQMAHTCWRNYDHTKSSSSMETNIILDIFRTSLDKHVLIYKNIICDGDSSVFRALETARVYREYNIDIHRTLCSNHILRRLSTNLVNLSKSPQFSYSNSMTAFSSLVASYQLRNRAFPFSRALNLRTLLTDNTGTTVNTIRAISAHWREQIHMSFQQQLDEFRIDLENTPYHVFGHHDECRDHYCQRNEGYKYYEYLLTAGVWNHVLACFSAVIASANDVLLNYNNNIAESFNSVVNRVLGGDRIDFSKLSRSYSFRVCCAVIHFNSRDGLCQVYRSMGKEIPEELQYVEENDQRKKDLYNLRDKTKQNPRRHHPRYNNCNRKDCFYGPGADIVMKPVENIEELKEQHTEKIMDYQRRRDEIQLITMGQSNNEEWHKIRRSILTASHFKEVCSARKETTKKNVVKRIIYSSSVNSAATNHGKANEKIARESLAAELNETIKDCGIFIDDEIPCLGASPDGLINDDGLVEIKCPYSLRNEKIEDAISKYENRWVKQHFNKNKTIKKISDYYHQIQGQLHVTRRKYCWLGIWTFKGLCKIKIDYDHEFWIENMEAKLIKFYWDYLVPELLDPRLQSNVNLENENDTNENESENEAINNVSKSTTVIDEFIGCNGQTIRWSLAPVIRLRQPENDIELTNG